MLKQGIVPNANRGHYRGGDRRRRTRKEVEEEGKRVGGVERDANHDMFGGKH